MNSSWLVVVGLFLGLGGASAEAGFLKFSAETPISTEQAQRQFDAVVEVAGLSALKPVLEIAENPSYAIASVAGSVPRVVVSRTYLSRVTRAALKFAFAHELAHLHLKHHAQIKNIRLQQEAQLAAAPSFGTQEFSKTIRTAYHAIEYSADTLAMNWCYALGCNIKDAALALSQAYGFYTRETETHPALDSRIDALRFHHDIP